VVNLLLSRVRPSLVPFKAPGNRPDHFLFGRSLVELSIVSLTSFLLGVYEYGPPRVLVNDILRSFTVLPHYSLFFG